MKIYLKQNVFDAAKERIADIMDEFPNVGVWFSGGKDSTVTLELVLQVAEEKGRLPVPVCFVDQEAEWGAVVKYIKKIMKDPRVKPMWLQVPIKLFNATSMNSPWLNCWAKDEEWMRPKEDIAIKENVYKTDRFGKMFNNILRHHYKDETVAFFGGVRTEESPGRAAGLTNDATYKAVTWGKILDKKRGHYTFYPLYDWSYRDIWKAIHEHAWDYCKIYDEFFRYGIAPYKMRVSNLHHETAVDQLFYLQEMEAETWEKLTNRLEGINQTRHMSKTEMLSVKELPYMFKDWAEYRDYLVENLVKGEETRSLFCKKFEWMDEKFSDISLDYVDYRHQVEVNCVLANDFHFTKIINFLAKPEVINFLKHKRGKPVNFSRPEKDLRLIKREQRL